MPFTSKENKIRNAKDEIIADIQKLEEELPENCQQNKDYIFPLYAAISNETNRKI